ncbi:MAG: glutathione S-transferase [Myxococcales bacterium]|nr:glutathione S-transferase [Myxococcales bacterium]
MLLHIGDKNYSSWSLRAWLVLRWAQLPFEEHVIFLDGEGYGRGQIPAVKQVSPSGRVPALHVDGTEIWDSLAIAEWAAEQVPGLWPADRVQRALCRSVTCEMHSGFTAIRRDLPMNIRRRLQRRPELPADTEEELERLAAMWTRCQQRSGGWLFGQRSIADAFYAPVATRLRTYCVTLPEPAMAWCEALWADEAFREWEAASAAEDWSFEPVDALYR